MNAPLRCNCDECRKLDKLPTRKQGWPGCYQLLLPDTVTSTPPVNIDVESLFGPVQQPIDDLPLFGGGADEPYLL